MAIFCNGKKAVCLETKCSEGCPHYDESGGYYVQTVIEKIKCTTEDEWVEFIMKLMYADELGFDVTNLFCDGEAGCITEDGDVECNDDRRRECIKRWLNSPVKEVQNG